jgi:hypothetical protein
VTVPLLRTEDEPSQQDATVMSYAHWPAVSPKPPAIQTSGVDRAHRRGPMTLLVETAGPLSDEERRRIDRFVVILGRQAE